MNDMKFLMYLNCGGSTERNRQWKHYRKKWKGWRRQDKIKRGLVINRKNHEASPFIC